MHLLSNSTMYPFYGIPSVIALNMVMSVATGGIVAILIASSAQVSRGLFFLLYYMYSIMEWVVSFADISFKMYSIMDE